jgi:hypothetical protein
MKMDKAMAALVALLAVGVVAAPVATADNTGIDAASLNNNLNNSVVLAAGVVPIADTNASKSLGNNGAFSGPEGDHDSNAYWVDISGAGMRGTVAQAAGLANTVCTKLEDGFSEGQLIAAGADGDQSKIPIMTRVVHAAEWHFCPSYY